MYLALWAAHSSVTQYLVESSVPAQDVEQSNHNAMAFSTAHATAASILLRGVAQRAAGSNPGGKRCADVWIRDPDVVEALSGPRRFEGGAVATVRGEQAHDPLLDRDGPTGPRSVGWRARVFAAAPGAPPLHHRTCPGQVSCRHADHFRFQHHDRRIVAPRRPDRLAVPRAAISRRR